MSSVVRRWVSARAFALEILFASKSITAMYSFEKETAKIISKINFLISNPSFINDNFKSSKSFLINLQI